MKKNIMIIGIVALLAIVAVALIYTNQDEKNSLQGSGDGIKAEIYNVNGIEDIDQAAFDSCDERGLSMEDCYLSLSVIYPTTELCEAINNVDKKDQCYINIASVKINEDFCTSVSQGRFNECTDAVITERADQNNDASLCEQIQDIERKEFCVQRVYAD